MLNGNEMTTIGALIPITVIVALVIYSLCAVTGQPAKRTGRAAAATAAALPLLAVIPITLMIEFSTGGANLAIGAAVASVLVLLGGTAAYQWKSLRYKGGLPPPPSEEQTHRGPTAVNGPLVVVNQGEPVTVARDKPEMRPHQTTTLAPPVQTSTPVAEETETERSPWTRRPTEIPVPDETVTLEVKRLGDILNKTK